jgi:hypothetical protein
MGMISLTQPDYCMPSVGQWIRWVTEWRAREGRVTLVNGPSMRVRFLGDADETVFPWGFIYFDGEWGDSTMQVIERPRGAVEMERRVDSGMMGVREAAAALGTTSKRVRALLRSGALEGERRDGQWVEVASASVKRRLNGKLGQSDMD